MLPLMCWIEVAQRNRPCFIAVNLQVKPYRKSTRPGFFEETYVTVAGQPWTLRFRSLPSFDAKTSSTLSSFVALAGLLIDALLFVVILQLVQLKRRDAELVLEMSRQLVDTEQRFEVAVSGSRDGIWDWDITANAVFLSAGWKAMLGYQDAELENSYDTWMQLMHPDDLERVMLRMAEYLEGQQPGMKLNIACDIKTVIIDGCMFAALGFAMPRGILSVWRVR